MSVATRVVVHNIGHHDAYVVLRGDDGEEVLARPVSGAVHRLGDAVWAHVQGGAQLTPVGGTDYWSLEPSLDLSTSSFDFTFGLRGRGGSEDLPAGSPSWLARGALRVVAVRLPLLHAALVALQADGLDVHFAVITSGPQQEDAPQWGKSPEPWGAVLAQAAKLRGCASTQHFHHVTEDAFVYEGLPDFLHGGLLPWVEARRRAVVEAVGEDWNRWFDVVLSVSTGTSPRIVALLSAFSPFHPMLFHVPDARRWPPSEARVGHCLDHDALRQVPARPLADHHGPAVRVSVEEMRRWRAEYVRLRPRRQDKNLPTEEGDFFFRKGRHEVLAVVVIQVEDALVAVRGVNVEVSLPTGSLCAERNAIGTAIMLHPNLLRSQIRAVAVLSMRPGRPRLGPCGACNEWLRKVAEVNPDFKLVTFADEDATQLFVEGVT